MNINFEFQSSDHLRFENKNLVSGPHGGARRLVKVEPNITGLEGYSVSIYNLDGNHPLWNNNIQMGRKQMKIIKTFPQKTILQGFGSDPMGNPFIDYGLTIYWAGDTVSKCVLHMVDRGVDIEYLA